MCRSTYEKRITLLVTYIGNLSPNQSIDLQIMDLLSLEVEISKIRKYVEIESGVKMSRAFFYDIEKKMKLSNDERHISDKRLKELSDKMSGKYVCCTYW